MGAQTLPPTTLQTYPPAISSLLLCETLISYYNDPVKLISWNVNGLRAVLRRNFLEYLEDEAPDILCLQETRAGPNDVEQLWPLAYTTYWNVAETKGYSGTAIFTKSRPLQVSM